MRIGLIVSLRKSAPARPKMSLVKEVRHCIDCIEGGTAEEAERSWNRLRFLQNKLTKVESPSDVQKKLLKMMRPVIEKYAQLDPRGVELQAGSGEDE